MVGMGWVDVQSGASRASGWEGFMVYMASGVGGWLCVHDRRGWIEVNT